jgi:phospholipid/cholesterol/gamma-HCH transport system substrate-binding protein
MRFLLVLALLLGGCSATGDGLRVTVRFRDVLGLERGAEVRVGDGVAGRVEAVRLTGFTAEAVLRVDRGTRLPGNAVAEIRQTSLLGEKYVELAPPPAGIARRGSLADGAVIPAERTGHGAEVEEVLSALSVLITGGGIEQLGTITRELSAALDGREDRLRSTLRELEAFVRKLDSQKADVVRALASVDRLTRALAAQRRTITTALDRIRPGLGLLAEQRAQLTAMLAALGKLGAAGTAVITGSKQNLLADLRALRPVLDQLAAAGTYLPRAMELLLTYPFPRTAQAAVTNGALATDADLGPAPPPARPKPPTSPKPTPPRPPSPRPAGVSGLLRNGVTP